MGDTVLQVSHLNIGFDTEDGKQIEILHDINFSIQKGEFVLLCGSSGSGKSTLANCLNGIIPNLVSSVFSGEVLVNGLNTTEEEMHRLSSEIGLVFQNPEDQIFSIRVCDEVAFGAECQGESRAEIVKRVDYALEKLRIKDIEKKITFTLSGGQKQKVSIASNLSMLPSIIVLDDPTTDLDPVSKKEVMDILRELKEEIDATFIVIEHDLTELAEFADRMLVMHEGHLIFDGKPAEIFYDSFDKLSEIGIRIPDQIKIGKRLKEYHLIEPSAYPIRVLAVEKILRTLLMSQKIGFQTYKKPIKKSKDPVVKVENLSFTYPGNKQPTLKNIHFQIQQGELFGIVGHNGSGKSTLMQNILGIYKPTTGDIWMNGKNTKELKVENLIQDIGYCFQNPDNQLFCNTVREEIEFGMKNKGVTQEEIDRETERALDIVGLKNKEHYHPFALSRGERQRLAVATMLVEHPNIIMLDEPTTGLDEQNLTKLLKLMEDIITEYKGTLIMVTHDMEVVSDYVDKLIVVDHGEIKLQGDTYEVFSNHTEDLLAMNLKPTTIGIISAMLKDLGVPYIPNWNVFQSLLVVKAGLNS